MGCRVSANFERLNWRCGEVFEEGCDEEFEECFSAFSGVVNELKEADVER